MRWLLHPATSQGVAIQYDWYVYLACAMFVGIFVYGCIAWCLFRYRRKPGREAERFENNSPLEIAYVAIPLLLVIGLFIVSYAVEVPIDIAQAHPQNRVAVTAFRWSFRFAYEGTGISTVGTPERPPTLYLPLDRVTEIDLTSVDVTHSFWVPAFLFKRDAIPGMMNAFDVTPQRTGTFRGRCAQFCGLDHALMSFRVKVVPAAAYDRFLASGGTWMP
ncbi:MAG: cytochrome c oxidase subunit II [Candidatus Tyrphobacter sp.]